MEVRKVTMDDETLNGEVSSEQTVEIDGVEYSIDEAKELLGKGMSFKELTEAYPDVDFKELPKAFTKTRQELAEYKKPKAENIDETEAERRKKLDEFFDDPYVQSKLGTQVDKRDQKIREDLELEKTLDNLENEYDGTDGRPKFNRREVLKYGMDNGIFNARSAYKDMHHDKLVEWAVKKANEKKNPAPFYEKRGTSTQREPLAVTPKTFKEATEAALSME